MPINLFSVYWSGRGFEGVTGNPFPSLPTPLAGARQEGPLTGVEKVLTDSEDSDVERPK